MSDRLRNLLATIDRALYGQGSAGFSPAHELLVSGWMLALQEEIAERERPLEGALAEILREHDVDREIVIATQAGWPETRGARLLSTLRARIEALALRGARPATRAEWAAIAADLAQDEGGVTEGLARAVAAMLPRLVEHESVRGALLGQVVGPWGPTYRSSVPQSKAWHRCSLDSTWDALVIKHPGFACFVAQYRKHGTREIVSLGADFPTLREAMLAADAALRSEGRILLGGLPEEVASGPGVDGVTCYACAGPSLRTRGVVVDACPVCGGARTVPRIATPGPAPEVETFGEVARRALESVRQLPDDPQPDASWLQETTGLSLDRWWYRGTVPPVDVSITGASAFDVLLSWIIRRGLLASWREVPSLRGSYTVEIVTRAPLDLGAREGT